MNFLQEQNGQFSSMRLMCLIALLAGIYIAVTSANVELTMIFVTAAFSGKVAQKFSENKDERE